MPNLTENRELYFQDPRLEMSHIGRLAVRIIRYSGYGIIAAACATFLVSDVPRVFWIGALLALFLLDRYLHRGEAEKSFGHRLGTRVNAAHYLAPASCTVLEYAFDRAALGQESLHMILMRRLIERKEIRGALWRMGIVPEELEKKLADQAKNNPVAPALPREQLKQAVAVLGINAFQHAIKSGGKNIDPKDIFAALPLAGDAAVDRIFQLFDISPEDVEYALIFSRFRVPWWQSWSLPSTLGGFAYRSHTVPHRVMNRAWSARPTPTLDRVGEDLTDYARLEKIGFLIGHQEEYERIIDVLARPARPNVVLIGDAGSGKEAIIAHLAYQIVKDRVPPELFDKRIVSLNIGSLVAGVAPGELEQRVRSVIEEIIKAGNVILYIPDIHNLSRTSGTHFLNAIDILLPAISGTDFSVIGATTPKDFKERIESQSDFAHAFEAIPVKEVSEADAIRILVYHGILLERQYRITVSLAAIKQAVTLAKKYFRDRLLPGSAEELLKEALAHVRENGQTALRPEDVTEVAQRKTSIPLERAGTAEASQLLNLEEIIHRQLIDQEPAVTAVAQALREYRSGLSRKGGPIASFLFVGPTGVGKTELAKILAKIQFNSEQAMHRFDMSEYQDRASIARFIGSPDGQTSGALTEAVLRQPYSLVLLDEFEKAHSDIFNLFLQVLDDGRLTDSVGRTVDFQNTIIIATSNAHSTLIKERLESGMEMSAIAEEVKRQLTSYFQPELINRFSRVIVFKNLSPDDVLAITRLQLANLAAALDSEQKIKIDFSEEAVRLVAAWGYDPVFGARPLRTVISEKIRSVLAEKILKNELSKGGAIAVTVSAETLEFTAGTGN